jgi:hypothetical protein
MRRKNLVWCGEMLCSDADCEEQHSHISMRSLCHPLCVPCVLPEESCIMHPKRVHLTRFLKEHMGIDLIPASLRKRYLFDERHHATSILAIDFEEEFRDLMRCLEAFHLRKTDILTPGGGRSPIPIAIDGFLSARKWTEKSFDIKIIVDEKPIPIPSHKIDNFKNRVGVEVEWNNEAEFYDRDLNNFRLLWELRVLSVGVIITRLSELQQLFDKLGRGKSYGKSTTHWDKLTPKVDSGGAGGCPLLLVGMGMACYDPGS